MSRETVRVQQMLFDVAAEIAWAREHYPKPDGLMTALTEETGEVAKAMLDESMDRVYKECVQVAAMAVRLALEGDPTLLDLRMARHKAQWEKAGKK